MNIIEKPRHFLGALYGPYDMDPIFYEDVLNTYRRIIYVKRYTPHIEEVEEWVFNDIIDRIERDTNRHNMGNHLYQTDYLYKEEILDSVVREFLEGHANKIAKDIEKSLLHAEVAFFVEAGDEDICLNSAQVRLFTTKRRERAEHEHNHLRRDTEDYLPGFGVSTGV